MRKRIGDFLIDRGVIDQQQLEQILTYSKERGLRFGEAGLELGLVKREDLVRVFGPNFRVDFFHLDPRYLPDITRELFDSPTLLKYGVLPLGFKTEYSFFKKKKKLNLGLLNPGDSERIEKLEAIAKEKLGKEFSGVNVYLILADQFFNVLKERFQMTDEKFRNCHQDEVDETLQLFLDEELPEANPDN